MDKKLYLEVKKIFVELIIFYEKLRLKPEADQERIKKIIAGLEDDWKRIEENYLAFCNKSDW